MSKNVEAALVFVMSITFLVWWLGVMTGNW